MVKEKVKTENKQVQTIIHCYPFILNNNDLVCVNCNRGCQTAASTGLDRPNSDLYPILEYTPYQLISEGALREIDLPRQSLLHWKSLSDLSTVNTCYERNLLQHHCIKSSLKKTSNISYRNPIMSTPQRKSSCDSNTQTDISVSPHVLTPDEVANVHADVSMQTTITCLPAASVSTILPQLRGNLLHETHEDDKQSDRMFANLGATQQDNQPSSASNKLGGTFENTSKINLGNLSILKYEDYSSKIFQKDIFPIAESTYQVHSLQQTVFPENVLHQSEPEEEEPGGETEPPNEEIIEPEVQEQTEPEEQEPAEESEAAKESEPAEESEPAHKESIEQAPEEQQEPESSENPEIHKPTEPEQTDNTEDESDTITNDLTDDETGPVKYKNCSCGSNALRRIANQFRSGNLALLAPDPASSDVQFEHNVVGALNSMMSALQAQIARVIDSLSDSEGVASTSCNCVDSPLAATDDVKVIFDDKRNTLHIKINQYTEMDEFRLSRNVPGDHVGHKSNSIECECQPSHSGAAPPHSFSRNQNFFPSAKKIKPRGPTVSSRKTSFNSPSCNKTSSHKSKIPTSSLRGKRSLIQSSDAQHHKKTCCKDRSTGVQTILALGDKLQSESLNSLDDYGGNTEGIWNDIILPAPGTYSIKSVDRACPNAQKRQKSKTRNDRSFGHHSEPPRDEIPSPKNNVTRVSNTCFKSPSAAQGKKVDDVGKVSAPSITIKINSGGVTQSKSCTNPCISRETDPKTSSSVPALQNEGKTKVVIKIVGEDNKEIIREMSLKPGDNTMVLNLNDLDGSQTDIPKAVESESGRSKVSINEEKEDVESSKISKDETDEPNEHAKTEAGETFVPAHCTCKDDIKFNTFKPDPIMVAMETCESEMKPLRQALAELQMKVRNLNIPELKGCMCRIALNQNNVTTDNASSSNVPRFSEPSILNTKGTCPYFKPAKLSPEVHLPFGRLPPPPLTVKKPIDVYEPISYHFIDNSTNKKPTHSCTCRKRKNYPEKHGKDDALKKIKQQPHEVHPDNSYEKLCKRCMYVSTIDMNSPFIYKRNSKNCEAGSSKQFTMIQSSSKDKPKETSYKDPNYNNENSHVNTDDEMALQREKQKQKKKKHRHSNKYVVDSSVPYHSVFDVQNLRPRQAVTTDPDDFLLPSKGSINNGRLINPHSLYTSIFSKAVSK